eukprot:2443250-Rhodomonas_salina.2
MLVAVAESCCSLGVGGSVIWRLCGPALEAFELRGRRSGRSDGEGGSETVGVADLTLDLGLGRGNA